MGAWKQFTTKDVTQTPFTADKGWNLTGSAMTGSDYGVNFFQGINYNYSSSQNVQTGFVFSSSVNSIWNSAKQLYYTNYRSSSTGDYLTTASVIRVKEGGEILDRIPVETNAYACMLGGEDLKTLFICTSNASGVDPEAAVKEKSGKIEIVKVDVPGAGKP